MKPRKKTLLVTIICVSVLVAQKSSADELPRPLLSATPVQLSATVTPVTVEELKRQIEILGASLHALQPTPAPLNTSAFLFAKKLRKGDRGSDVTKLQELLATDPTIYPEGIVNGNFGPKTALAVKRFQARYGLDQAGTVGPKTLERINDLLKTASTGSQIPPTFLQQAHQEIVPALSLLKEGEIGLQSSYVAGVHHVVGRIQLPNPCYSIDATSTVTTTASGTIATVQLTSAPIGGICLAVLAEKAFRTEFVAPEQVNIVLLVNGKVTPIKHDIAPKSQGATNLPIPGSVPPIPLSSTVAPSTIATPAIGKIIQIPTGFRLDQPTSAGVVPAPSSGPSNALENRWWGYQATTSVSTSTQVTGSGTASASASANVTVSGSLQ